MTAEMDKNPASTSSRRPLRRSKTITCNVYPATRPLQENVAEEKSGEVPSSDKASPKSSCQALRHAVSALTRLDDFICEKIGAGFFSEVFKVTHRITGQVMALKMNTMTSNRHNMLREVQLLNRLQHPNTLRFMGVCVHEGQLHALTEYIPDGSLEQLLANKDEELPWTQRIQLTLGLAKGLDYLHSQGFLHRDLTSKNVLVKREDHDYHAVLADFGLAFKIPDPLSQEKLPTVGSPYWMAPEVLNGNFYNERADIFSVGIIMCEITARISADPDIMPRMNNFGVDYVALSEMISYCPLDYLQLAFKCCQVDPMKRPRGCEIIEWLEKIFKNLKNDIFTRQEKEKSERNGYKRSRSEDNILQANDSEADTSSEDIIITPQLIGQVMSRDDPSYVPSSTNPFAAIQRFQHGRKLLGTSMDFAAEVPSPCTPPSTPNQSGLRGKDGIDGLELRRCQSLPSSPVLLRRAAEKLHQESLHGSARYCHQHQQSQSMHVARARSKSTVFSEAFARRLQAELSSRQHPEEQEDTTWRQISESHLETESCSLCEESALSNGKNCQRLSCAELSQAKQVNGCQNKDNSMPRLAPSTATRRRMLRKAKYQSLDGDAMGIPPIQPLHSNRHIHEDIVNGRPASSILNRITSSSSSENLVRSQADSSRTRVRKSSSRDRALIETRVHAFNSREKSDISSSKENPDVNNDGDKFVSSSSENSDASKGRDKCGVFSSSGKRDVSKAIDKSDVGSSSDKRDVSKGRDKSDVGSGSGKRDVSKGRDKSGVFSSSDKHDVSKVRDKSDVGSGSGKRDVSKGRDKSDVGSGSGKRDMSKARDKFAVDSSSGKRDVSKGRDKFALDSSSGKRDVSKGKDKSDVGSGSGKRDVSKGRDKFAVSSSSRDKFAVSSGIGKSEVSSGIGKSEVSSGIMKSDVSNGKDKSDVCNGRSNSDISNGRERCDRSWLKSTKPPRHDSSLSVRIVNNNIRKKGSDSCSTTDHHLAKNPSSTSK